MGSSAKKKREKKKDFQKAKLKVGKTRPKNTNATDTSFTAKSIVLKQQNLSEGGRDARALFEHNLSLLTSKSETQRRDALQFLQVAVQASRQEGSPPQPVALCVAKAQPLMLDASAQVRQQLLKLLRAVPTAQVGPVDQLLLYTRAGMAHLSDSIRATSLDVLDWLLETDGEAVVSCAGGWIKTLRTFQNLLSWRQGGGDDDLAGATKWSTSKSSSNNLGGGKLLVHQLTSLSRLLSAGLSRASIETERRAAALRVARHFPLWHADVHLSSRKSDPYGYLNLFNAPRDVESEVYDDADERTEVFIETGLLAAFQHGVAEVKKEGGEVGRAAAAVEKSLRTVDGG